MWVSSGFKSENMCMLFSICKQSKYVRLTCMTAVHLAPHFICICNLREDICILFWHILVDVNHLDAKLPFPSAKTSLTQFFSAEGVTVHGSVCSFCVCLCGWTCSLCLSALPNNRAPDEVIRTVTGVARLHCLYLAGVSVMRCQIVVLLLWCTYSLCQSSRSWSCSRLVAFQYIPVGCGLDCILCPSWRLCTAGFTAPALPMISAPPLCLESAPALPAYLTSTVFWSCQIKTLLSLAIGSRAFCTVTERSDQDGSSECVRIKRLFSSQ